MCETLMESLSKELEMIGHPDIQSRVRGMLCCAPDKSLTIPASKTGKYHSEDEALPGGNLLHTRRVFAMVNIIAEAKDLPDTAADFVRAAALIHDILKQGPLDGPCDYTEYLNHGTNLWLWHAEHLGEPDYISRTILDIASRHMARWMKGSRNLPNSEMADCLCIADYMASRKWLAPVIPI